MHQEAVRSRRVNLPNDLPKDAHLEQQLVSRARGGDHPFGKSSSARKGLVAATVTGMMGRGPSKTPWLRPPRRRLTLHIETQVEFSDGDLDIQMVAAKHLVRST